jgi:hypothetical protein
MVQEFSLLGFVAHLHAIERDMEQLPMAILAKACAMIAKQAKAQIGREHEMWPPLAPATIADKARHGFSSSRAGFDVVPAAGMRVAFDTEFDPQRGNDRAVNVVPL